MTVLVDNYVRQVELACADLPEEQRRRLVADLAAHLREVDTEAASIYAELGPPAEYARELRAALDLPPSPPQYSPTRFFRLPQRRPSRAVIAAVLAGVVLVLLVVVAVVAATSGSHNGGSTPIPMATPAPQHVTLPNVVGLPETDARTELAGLGARVRIVVVEGGTAVSGTVLTEDPLGGSIVEPGAIVTLEVAR